MQRFKVVIIDGLKAFHEDEIHADDDPHTTLAVVDRQGEML